MAELRFQSEPARYRLIHQANVQTTSMVSLTSQRVNRKKKRESGKVTGASSKEFSFKTCNLRSCFNADVKHRGFRNLYRLFSKCSYSMAAFHRLGISQAQKAMESGDERP